jgi:hypothetical protein
MDIVLIGVESDIGSMRRRYQVAELETGATLAALSDALEWRGIEPSNIVAVRCRPPVLGRRGQHARYRVIYARWGAR